jgi:CheY-like chemotaxis protein
MNVLIADDNETSRKLLRAVLEAEGHSVLVAGDGYEALKLLECYPVKAIICDLLMPWTVIDSVRRSVRRRAGPISLLFATQRFTAR